MKEKLLNLKDKVLDVWRTRSTIQKTVIVGSFLSLVALIVIVSIVAAKPKLVPLYSNLSLQEAGQIQETLTARGVAFEITNNGTAIHVPEAMVNTLMVDLAAEGIPNSGNIDYTFFGQNSGWGITDKEFNVLKVEAMQTELGNLIKNIDGVQAANVMLTIPEESIWVGQSNNTASASIVITQTAGYRFEQNQIDALYHLVSKSVPNLPIDNIVIMNQLFEPFIANNSTNDENNSSDAFATQYKIKNEIETDIQRQVQQMLGTMIGMDKVVVSVTADLDFTKEKRTEERYEPVVQGSNNGIARSVERITETFTGEGALAGGVVGAGETDIPNLAEVDGAAGDYERIEERVNNEVDKINKEIIESPYQVRNLGIQVVVDPTLENQVGENGEPLLLDEAQQQQLTTEIQQMLNTVIATSISGVQEPNTINEKISITMQPFRGRPALSPIATSPPLWMYIAGGVLLAVIGLLVFLLVKKKKREALEEEVEEKEVVYMDDVNDEKETATSQRRKQLERMAKEKPDEFAKLLRSWIAEE